MKEFGVLLGAMLDPGSAGNGVWGVCVCGSCIESGSGWSVARVIDSTGK